MLGYPVVLLALFRIMITTITQAMAKMIIIVKSDKGEATNMLIIGLSAPM